MGALFTVMATLFFVACGSGVRRLHLRPATTIGGMVTGLSGTGLVLQDNGGANLPVSASRAFTFTRMVTSGGIQSHGLRSHPVRQTCAVTSANRNRQRESNERSVACTANSTTFGVSDLNGTFYIFRRLQIFLRSAGGLFRDDGGQSYGQRRGRRYGRHG